MRERLRYHERQEASGGSEMVDFDELKNFSPFPFNRIRAKPGTLISEPQQVSIDVLTTNHSDAETN